MTHKKNKATRIKDTKLVSKTDMLFAFLWQKKMAYLINLVANNPFILFTDFLIFPKKRAYERDHSR